MLTINTTLNGLLIMRSFQNRQERLDNLIGLLENNNLWTAKALADSLDVSVRSISRDITLLRQQGYDIDAERGAGGGIELRGMARPPKFFLSDEEILNTLMALALTDSLNCPILGDNISSVKNKLTFFLNDEQRKRINLLRKRVLVGAVASETVANTVTNTHYPFLNDVSQAFIQQQKLSIRYVSEKEVETKRTIEPQFILLNWPAWYLLGWDYLRAAPRLFRIDRITDATVENGRFRLRSSRSLLSEYGDYFNSM
ncbi:WYL domain-containing protein [Vibrio cortegadensis]|uniref:helix-turn-helix transcriptional regulator n=1 Tax=Vibrio cortegadensis TaxID=1328770 RepID=UPI0021C42DC9|nr:WYL domain-containing protein [Vibrio cortegadensis]MDN3696331.1 WYL domain-containing protein [Vibrio cortegadensis]